MALVNAKRHRHMVAVMFLDLDRFKLINDSLGHAYGDQLLTTVAHRLTGCVPEYETVARMGGDEFTILLSEVRDSEEAVEVASKILKALEHPFSLYGREHHISASIGIAVYPNDGGDADTLMKHADAAMYRAKESGKNNCQLYNTIMNSQALQRMVLENDLRKALEREEFVVYYQPQVNIDTGQIVGAEALVRWLHPDMGLVGPEQFVPLAEDTGLIVPISEWVLFEACQQNRLWQDKGFPPMRMAVNFSIRQFQQNNLVDTVEQTLRRTGLDPRYLELEITENIAILDENQTAEKLHSLKNRGISVAMDDFGMGYSSLAYLKKYPIDTLKIDRSFLRDIVSTDNGAIATAIIAMANSLNLHVIAEGVEAEAQVAFLRVHQNVDAQGYLFSLPLPAEQFEELLQNQHFHGTVYGRYIAPSVKEA